MPRALSSGATFGFKFVLPVFWLAYVGTIGWVLFVSPPPPPLVIEAVVLAVLLGASGFILWVCTPLKRVRLDGGTLLVSNLRREIRVPLAGIARVSERRWINIHPVTIELRVPTEFGRRVVFMPRVRCCSYFDCPQYGLTGST